MGLAKRTVNSKVNKVKLLKRTDNRLKPEHRRIRKKVNGNKDEPKIREVPRVSSALFLQYNARLGPPYHILLDTNFVNFSIKNKLDIIKSMTDCLYAKCKIVKDPRFKRLYCMHSGTYADDCIVQRVTEAKCYIVATCDKDLKRRIRKIVGVPIMYISNHRYTIERLPDAYGAPKN
ncbi:hypothetical protein M514_05106 [Trichuris suis]|uniref:PIN domain-containing protein n=1 Tax=Trichuris suis TaxID=68888 RepID=A0A085MA41_9BILA|nr:hypothetical protein M513_05106 [Trichuris suis]KFD63006.1 hypothetical protein M514_05106 [Trichuris suis]